MMFPVDLFNVQWIGGFCYVSLSAPLTLVVFRPSVGIA